MVNNFNIYRLNPFNKKMPKDKKSAAPKKGGEKEAGKEAKVEDKKPKVNILYK